MSLPNGKHRTTSTPASIPSTPYVVMVSKAFLRTATLLCIVLAFGAGIASRYIALHLYIREHPLTTSASFPALKMDDSSKSFLPSPKLIDGKVAPRTIYTAKNFDTAASVTTSSVHLQQDLTGSSGKDDHPQTCRGGGADEKACSSISSGTGSDTDTINMTASAPNNAPSEKEDLEEHLPAGQHLLVDIKNVDAAFLNSESRLAHAMVQVVNESKLTLLSYHCHSLMPTGVSCVGVLLESHVSFHTWPEEGVITLDLFTCGSGELVPVLPLIETAFAIPQQSQNIHDEGEEPVVVWTHKMRGFQSPKARGSNIWSDDLGKYLVEKTNLDMKVEVANTKTDFQRIHVFDIINAKKSNLLSYQQSMSNDGSYPSLHPEYYTPNRLIFLEGVLQSTRHGDEAYHEALVHPAMFAHLDPKKVGIIGGGEGATLREVLKHTTVEAVKMIEIDQGMVEFSRKYLPNMSNCSDFDFIRSADYCGDDERASILYEDGAAWINNRFSEERIEKEEYQEDPFDVLIMDAL